jgi:hypothetical protein
MPLPNGETMHGLYSISADGSVAVGALDASVYGPGGSASRSAAGTSSSISRLGFEQADMMNAQGTTAHCEFENNNFTGHGHGACGLSDGAVYRMQY